MANRYWVGGSGIWDSTSTANWSTVSGGPTGASAPTTADDVFFDANSGSGTVDVQSTATSGSTVFNKSGLNLSLSGDCTLCAISTFTLTGGTVTLNNYTLTVRGFLSSATTSRTIDFGAGGVIVANSPSFGALVIDFQTTTNLTILGTPRVTTTGNTAAVNIQGNATTSTAINYTFNTFTILTNGYSGFVGDVNINAFFGTNTGTITVYGNFIAASGIAYFGVSSNDWIFSTSVSKTLTCPYTLRRVTFDGSIFNANGVWSLGSALTVSNQIYLNRGRLNTNNYNVTCLGFISDNLSIPRTLDMGSSRFTINVNSNSTPSGWRAVGSTMTVIHGTSTIYINQSFNTSFSSSDIYNILEVESNNNVLTINGSNRFAVLRRRSLSSTSFTISFEAGSTTTVNDFQIKGTTSGPINYPITLNSTTPGSTFTLTSPSDTVSVDYLNIKDSVATGKAKWYAGNNSIDSGNNTGWIFTAPPSAGFLMFF